MARATGDGEEGAVVAKFLSDVVEEWVCVQARGCDGEAMGGWD